MNKEAFNTIRKELSNVGFLFIAVFMIFKLVYYKDPLLTSLRFAASLFWMFVLSSYFIMLYWKDKLDFTERLIIGIGLSAAVIGIASYYIGLMGLNISYHGIFLPLIMIVTGLTVSWKK